MNRYINLSDHENLTDIDRSILLALASTTLTTPLETYKIGAVFIHLLRLTHTLRKNNIKLSPSDVKNSLLKMQKKYILKLKRISEPEIKTIKKILRESGQINLAYYLLHVNKIAKEFEMENLDTEFYNRYYQIEFRKDIEIANDSLPKLPDNFYIPVSQPEPDIPCYVKILGQHSPIQLIQAFSRLMGFSKEEFFALYYIYILYNIYRPLNYKFSLIVHQYLNIIRKTYSILYFHYIQIKNTQDCSEQSYTNLPQRSALPLHNGEDKLFQSPPVKKQKPNNNDFQNNLSFEDLIKQDVQAPHVTKEKEPTNGYSPVRAKYLRYADKRRQVMEMSEHDKEASEIYGIKVYNRRGSLIFMSGAAYYYLPPIDSFSVKFAFAYAEMIQKFEEVKKPSKLKIYKWAAIVNELLEKGYNTDNLICAARAVEKDFNIRRYYLDPNVWRKYKSGMHNIDRILKDAKEMHFDDDAFSLKHEDEIDYVQELIHAIAFYAKIEISYKDAKELMQIQSPSGFCVAIQNKYNLNDETVIKIADSVNKREGALNGI